MKFIEHNKGAVAILIVFATLIFVYKTFFNVSAPSVISDITAEGVGKEVVDLNEVLQRATLDTAIFSSPLYLSLKDFTVAIPSQPVGRNNPFDKIAP